MIRKLANITIGIFIIILTVFSASAAHVDSNVEDALNSGQNVDVIIVMNDDAESYEGSEVAPLMARSFDFELELEEKKERIKERQDRIVGRVNNEGKKKSRIRGRISVASSDFEIRHKYSTINAMSGKINSAALRKLRNDPDVKAVYKVPKLKVSLNDSNELISTPEMHRVQVNGVNLTGEGETLCILDTGIDTDHSAFSNKILDEYCFCEINNIPCCPNGQNEDTSAEDDNSHGSHCSGIASGNSSHSKGVAPDSKIVMIKVCNSVGDCDGSGMLAGIDWCVNNASKYNISSISISIGSDTSYSSSNCPDWGFIDPVDEANNLGIIVSVSSGNSGSSSGVSWPACIDNATAVGGSTKSDAMASYTNYGGGRLDLIAPGSSIFSAWNNGGYGTKSGTSMAAPHVAGAYLLISQASRLMEINWTVREVEQAFNKSAGVRIGGFPRIDIISALNYLKYNFTINTTASSISKENFGKISFAPQINFTDVGGCIEIKYNNVSVNTSRSECSVYNTPANITIENITWAHVKILKDGNDCPGDTCTLISYSGGQAVFNATGFSSYSTNGTYGIMISDDTDTLRKDIGQQIKFYANFSNSTGETINGTNVNCTIKFNITLDWEGHVNMSYNLTSQLYEYNRSFSSFGNYSFNVMCDGLEASYGQINTTDDFYVDMFPNITKVLINSTSLLNRTNESITCWVNASNEEYTTLYAYYSWYNDSVFFSSGTSSISNATLANISILSSSTTKKGQQWECRVFTGDGIVNETDNTTALITIVNIPPSFNQSLENRTVEENSTISYHINCSDADESDGIDSISYYINDSSEFTLNISTGVLNWTPGFNKAGNYSYNITCGDGSVNVSQIFTINVTNLNRIPSNTSVVLNSTSGGNYSTDNITCWAYGQDEDGGTLNAHFRWHNGTLSYLNGTTAITSGLIANISTISSLITRVDENWTCSLKIGDGEANETGWHNASLTIKNSPPSFNQSLQNQAVDENSELYYDINCSDPEDVNVTYYINDTSKFEINFTTGEINWTPSFYDSGLRQYTVTCGDNTANSSQEFSITVSNIETYHPNLTIISPANESTWTSSGTVTFTYNISDDTGVANCSLTVNNETVYNTSAISNNGYSTFSWALSNENYNWSINCTDSSSSAKTANSSVYALIVSYSPPSGGSSGGGGGGGSTLCNNECAEGQRGCVVGKNAYVSCGNYDGDNCLEWGSETFCAINEVCEAGYCEIISPSWLCDEWNDCADGMKTRECADLEGFEAPKTESIGCEIAVIEEIEPEIEIPAPVSKPTFWEKSAGVYEKAKPYALKIGKYTFLTFVLSTIVILLASGIGKLEKALKISHDVSAYQKKVENDFMKTISGKKKRGR